MRITLARWGALGLPAALGLLPLLLAGAAAARPEAVTLDGLRDADYALLAVDAPGDLAPALAAEPEWVWAELSALYVASDTTHLYVYAALPGYGQSVSTGEIGLAIDTTGDAPNSGGGGDPWLNAITFSYTSTHNITGSLPVTTAIAILPDVVIRGNIPGYLSGDNGWTEWRAWNGSGWDGLGANWGGLGSGDQAGDHIAYADGEGVELAIPFASLGVAPTATLHLQFFTTRGGQTHGAYDTVPADAQAGGPGMATTQRRLATVVGTGGSPPPTAAPVPCATAAAGDGAIVAAGLYHDDADLRYRDPLGAVAVGAAAELRLRTCADDVQQAAVLVWATGDPEPGAEAVYGLAPAISSGGYVTWTTSVPAPAQVADQWYLFRLIDGAATSYYHPTLGNHGPGAWSAALQGPLWELATLPPPPAGYEVPAWLPDAIVYQIALDRFRNGDVGNDPAPGQTVYGPQTCGGGPCATTVHAGWNEAPSAPDYGVDYYGGDLQGVIEKIQAGYFTDLGVDALLLSQPFATSSSHGHDVNDYYAIAPHLGTSATVAALVNAADAAGLRLIFETELNYAGADGYFLDGYGRWPTVLGACETELSPYRAWFTPGSLGGCVGGWGWQGTAILAELQETDAVRAFFYRGGSAHSPGGVAVANYWLAQGLAGLGFTSAEALSHGWFQDLRPYLKTYGPETLVLGDLGAGCDADLYASYLNAGELDSVTSACFRDLALEVALGGAPSTFAAGWNELRAQLPPEAFAGLLNPLSGPAWGRALTLLGGDAARLRLAALLQMTLPGAPTIYYGDEVALAGAASPDDRRPYPWADLGGAPDAGLLGFYQQVIALRRAHAALRGPAAHMVLADDAQGLLGFVRIAPAETAVVVLNNSAAPRQAVVPVSGYLADGAVLADVLKAGAFYTVTGGTLSLPMAGRAGAVLAGSSPAPPPVVAFAGAGHTALEAAGLGNVTVAISGAHTRTISVTYTTLPGSAGLADFVPAEGVLVFAPGQAQRAITVSLVDDALVEAPESLVLALSAPVNAVLGAPAQATLTILDDDAGTPGRAARVYLPLSLR